MLLYHLVSPTIIYLLLAIQESSSAFRHLANSPVFVDKTPLLGIFFDDVASSVRQYVTCPSGFGKTTILDMIEFFSSAQFNYDYTVKIPNTTNSFDTFNRTRIAAFQKFINANLARYIVLRLDADDHPEYSTYSRELAYDFVYDILIKSLEKYSEILNKDRLNRSEKMFLEQLHEKTFDEKEIAYLLGYLVKMLHDHFQLPVILLVDNYDLPMKRSILGADSNPRVDILYDIFNEMIFYASKYPRDYLCRVVVMSTTSIPFNWFTNETKSFHLHEFAVKNAYDEFLGFTETDMKEIIAKWKLTPVEKKELREFYMFSHIHPKYDIYNPRTIVNYLKHKNQIKTNRTLHREIYQTPLDDFKFIIESFQNTEFEQKLFLLSSNQSIKLPGIWIGDKLTLSVLKNTTNYKDFVDRGFVWIYMLESAYVTYSTDGIGFQAANQEITYILRESLYDNFNRTRIPFDQIGSSIMEFVDNDIVLNNQSMQNSVHKFQQHLGTAFKNVNSTPEVHPREAVFASVIFIATHVSTNVESSMIVSQIEIRSNLTVASARYDVYCQETDGKKKTAVIMRLKSDDLTMQDTIDQVSTFLPLQHRFVKYLTYMVIDVDREKNVRTEYITHDADYIKNLSSQKKQVDGECSAKAEVVATVGFS